MYHFCYRCCVFWRHLYRSRDINTWSWMVGQASLHVSPLSPNIMRFVGIKYRAYFYVIVTRVFITKVIPSFQILSLNMAISASLYCALGTLHLNVLHSLQCHVMFLVKLYILVIFASKMHFFRRSVFQTVKLPDFKPIIPTLPLSLWINRNVTVAFI
jgi:hypothetical protein